MFEVGQLVLVKSVSDRAYLAIVIDSLLYLNSYEQSFYEVLLIGTKDKVTVPSSFIIPVNSEEEAKLRVSDPTIPYWPK
jgi:hypothetical protein